jgi:hypothetical protein
VTQTHPRANAPVERQVRVRALRQAREIVADMRWLGMPVPALYASMAEQFQGLVRSGAYATWVATTGRDGETP